MRILLSNCYFSIKAVPRCIRMDGGTENGYIENIQKSLRWNDNDAMSGEKSVIIGSSHTNQVISALV